MMEDWIPKTELGKAVKAGTYKNIDEVLATGKPILEHEIVDYLLPNLKSEILEIRATQRVTDSGRKTAYKVLAVVGDENGHVGYGIGKSAELAIARDKAVNNAKRNIISIKRGCGSWECRCELEHSIPKKVSAKVSATYVELLPAPRGLGLAANDNLKVILSLAGVKDVWSSVRGSKSNIQSLVAATFKALKQLY
ncbi:MAG: 30S ribosomal protein S5 [Candidatus Anstonellales archaeon]